MACDVEELCTAPCNLDPEIQGESAQAWALSQALQRILASITGEPATDIGTVLSEYPCLNDCVPASQAAQKMASVIYASTTFASANGRYCYKPNQVAAYNTFLMCSILNETG